jgi:hypothetical protein
VDAPAAPWPASKIKTIIRPYRISRIFVLFGGTGEISSATPLAGESRSRFFHGFFWRWIQYRAPELNRRCRRELRNTNGSWRVDET